LVGWRLLPHFKQALDLLIVRAAKLVFSFPLNRRLAARQLPRANWDKSPLGQQAAQQHLLQVLFCYNKTLVSKAVKSAFQKILVPICKWEMLHNKLDCTLGFV
jgi:hypothetical protein